MARLTRKNIKVFAGNASNNGVFGSLQANNPTLSNDVEQIQSLPAWGDGWNAATETSEQLPPLEEIQSVEYVTTYQQAYIMQEGLPEWAATVTYFKGCLVKEVTTNGFRIYNSLTDNNIGNVLTNTTSWKKVMDSEDLYAFDSTVLHKSGTETSNGDKTFSGDITFTGSVDASNASIVKAPTIATSDNSDSVATTKYVKNNLEGAVSTIATSNLTQNRALISNASGKVSVASTTNTELEYVHGVTSAIQTQLNSKAADSSVVKINGNQTINNTKTFASSPIVPTPSNSDNSTKAATTAYVKNILSAIYPVGSVYIGTQSTCPMASLISGSTWTLVSSGRALWTGTGSNGNTTIAAGLPNITGTFGGRDGYTTQANRPVNFDVASGAFSLNKVEQNYGTWDSGRTITGGKSVSFNASKSNSIYGNSSTVQPPAYVVNVWRRTA